MSIQDTQRQELANRVKLTAVTFGHGDNRRQAFVYLKHDSNGRAQIPHSLFDRVFAASQVG